MITIFKYHLQIQDSQKIEIPVLAKLLSAQEQNGELILWALVNTNNDKLQIEIECLGTGCQLTENS